MSRIPYPSLAGLSEIKHAYVHDPARKYLLNVTRMSLHIPDGIWAPHAALSRAAVRATTIDRRLRELVIVRVAHLQKSEYELFHHRSIAAGVGISRQELAALESEDVSMFPENERALIAFTTEVVRNVSPTDEALAAARSHFPDPLLFEVVVIIGYYMMTARVAAVGGVEPEETAISKW